MKKRILYLIVPVITLVLEILPYGAVCNFANPEGKPWRETYSYFDMIPFGYANFAPLLTAMITCAILILLIIYCFVGNGGITKTVKVLLYIGVPLSLCPLLFGIRFFSVVGALITAALVVELLLLQFKEEV